MVDVVPSALVEEYRFDRFVFVPATGELRSVDESADTSARLAPQPAKLLTLLLESNGELVSHEEIRDALWPDVHVEYDQSLHFCVRQIRSALGDTASNPRFIETLPRRGYRWITPIEARGTSGESQPEDARRSRLPFMIVFFVLALCGGAWLISGAARTDERVAVAIMPFVPPNENVFESDPRQIAVHLVSILSEEKRLQVVGPTTTEQYESGRTPLRDLIQSTGVSYIVNGRFAERNGSTQLLAELIRASDGAHVWTQWFETIDKPAVVAEIIQRAVIARTPAD